MDACFSACLLDLNNYNLLYANAGHQPIYMLRGGTIEKVVSHLRKISGVLKQNFSEIIYLLSGILSHYHKFLSEHSKRVAELSKLITEKLEFSKEEQEDIYYGALLHDLGLIGAGTALFEKKVNDFTKNEKQIYLQHPLVGQELISTVKNLKRIEAVIRSHHERINGRGFPDGLRSVKIPPGARASSELQMTMTI